MRKRKIEKRLRRLEKLVQNHILGQHSRHQHFVLGKPQPAFGNHDAGAAVDISVPKPKPLPRDEFADFNTDPVLCRICFRPRSECDYGGGCERERHNAAEKTAHRLRELEASVYQCKHPGCSNSIMLPVNSAFVNTMLEADWAIRRHVGAPPDCWCPQHAHDRPMPKPDLEVVRSNSETDEQLAATPWATECKEPQTCSEARPCSRGCEEGYQWAGKMAEKVERVREAARGPEPWEPTDG